MATNRRDITDRERYRELEGGGGGGRGGSNLPSFLQEPGRFGPTTLRPALNRPAQAGYTYRSPAQTNANSLTPHIFETAGRSQRADLGRMARGVTTPAASERGRAAQRAAGLRALSRTGGRAAYLAAAGKGGYELAEYAGEKMSNAEKKKLAAAEADARESKERADKEVDTSSADPDFVRGEQYGRGAPDGMKRGGQVKKMAGGGLAKKTDASPYEYEVDLAKRRAMREKEKSRRLPEASPKNAVYGMDASQDQSYKKGGMTSKASGASKRADGVAQRGKTKGRMC